MTEIERLKRNVEILIEERRQAIEAAAKWCREWKQRQRGFKKVKLGKLLMS